MSEKMTVYFVMDTGHVVGAVTRVDDRGPDGGLEATGREEVLVRGPGTDPFLIPGTGLATLVVAPDPLLLLSPRSFQVPPQGDEAVPLPAVSVKALDLRRTEVEVEMTTAVAADQAVWVQVAGGPLVQPLVTGGAILQGDTTVKLPVETLADGTYRVLALVRGHQPLAKTFTI